MTTFEGISTRVAERLGSRRAEIEQAIFAHVRNDMPDQADTEDAEYVGGLRLAIAAIVEYGLVGMERGRGSAGPIPPAAIAQARRAAHVGIRLETVVRRYVGGYSVLVDFILDEAHRAGLLGEATALRRLQRTQASLLDDLILAVTNEYGCEVERAASPEQRRLDIVLRLLAGASADRTELDRLGYELNVWHLGIIATGTKSAEALHYLKSSLHRELLFVVYGPTVCGWLGGSRHLAPTSVERVLSRNRHTDVALAIGEPGRGIEGWRLTHHQAQEARRVALRRPQMITWYADDPLLAVAMQNDTLARSLSQKYLVPLRDQGDGGAALRQTLRAYIDAGCVATSAASMLPVGRHAVESRVRTAETLIGRTLRTCLPELDVALRLASIRH